MITRMNTGSGADPSIDLALLPLVISHFLSM
jgi:hypothetical protein